MAKYNIDNPDSNPGIKEAGVKALTDNELPSLDSLWLSFTGINTEAVKILSKGNWANLKILHLAGNHFGSEGM